jgi:hypothetical protein
MILFGFPPYTDHFYSCLVVVFERVVVVPPSGSVTVIVWLSELPSTVQEAARIFA